MPSAVFVALGGGNSAGAVARAPGVPDPDPTAALGAALMGSKMLVMIIVSAVLLATVIAAMVLALPRGRYDRFGDDLRRRPPTDPQPGGVGR